jgi:cytochrome c biogenesis protein CcdA
VRRAAVPAAALAYALASVLACAPPAAAGTAGVSFTPASWNFGMILQGEVVEVSLAVANSTDRPLAVTLVPLCDCLSAAPASAVVAARSEAAFVLRYDSRDDTGNTRKNFLITTDAVGAERAYFEMRGTVRAERGSAQAPAPAAGEVPGPSAGRRAAIDVTYWYTPGCRSCEEFLASELPRIESELGVRLAVARRDLLDPAAYEELARAAAARGTPVRAIPVLSAGDSLLQGEKEIRGGTRRLLESLARDQRQEEAAAAAAAEAAADATGVGLAGGVPAGLSVLAVAAAGLLDGVNPCAFTTLIFLLSFLALGGRSRREILLIGVLFTLAVFLTYLGVGFGLFAALRMAAAVPLASRILRWVLVAVLVAFAGLSLYDVVVIRRGEPGKILLQLPSALKRQIHRSIRAQARAAALAGGALVLGFLVSIFEFACTGQVYLPTLAYLARTRRQASAAGLLVLYNACFVLPLIAVFAASWFGVTSTRIASLYQKRMAAVKLGLAAVFLALAALTALWG